jgi:hypothetical protein
MQPPRDREAAAPLDLLRHDLSQQVRLRDILRADHDAVPTAATRREGQ